MPEWLSNVIYLQGYVSTLILCGFIIASTLLQRNLMKNANRILSTLSDNIRSTTYYKDAVSYIERRNIDNPFVSQTFAIPVWFLLLLVMLCSFVSYFGANALIDNKTPSFVLGGVLSHTTNLAVLNEYQAQTIFTGVIAFFSAYVWIIWRMIVRINANDMSPITYYFFSVRILAATLVAGIARHVIEIAGLRELVYSVGFIPDTKLPYGLAILGFLIGWNPKLWIDDLIDKIWSNIKSKVPFQRWPENQSMPERMPLTIIQGILEDKEERLKENDIDNCQQLASENPILMWMRTPYNIYLICDWVAQAQLYRLVGSESFRSLQENGIRNVFSYLTLISDDDAVSKLPAKIALDAELARAHLRILNDDPDLCRLKELHDALVQRTRSTTMGELPATAGLVRPPVVHDQRASYAIKDRS
jgi:hypothetical protein